MAKAGSLLAVLGLLAGTGLAQQTGTPPTPQTAPMVPVQQAAPAPLPVLTSTQAFQLATLLSEGRFSHGLVRTAPADELAGTDNDALVRAALDYAHAVHSGRLDTGDFDPNWGLRPAPYDPLPAFADAVKRNDLARWIESLWPRYAGYDGLRKGLDTYRRIDAAGGWSALAAGPDLTIGTTGARVIALRKRLAIEDAQVATTSDTYDADLAEAVKRAQRRYGLNPTGAVAAQTRAALNVPAADRVRQIMANMERWRWLPGDLPKNRIQVNIAAAVLTVFDGDAPIASMKAVTGAPGGRETPMLQSKIHSIVLNPPWNVPPGIAAKELFPKGPAYLASHGFKVIGEGPNKRLQQVPGKSALGRYKFDFANPYAVYLHDTPSQATFNSFDRLASHGCVRLEKPAPLARLLLRNEAAWPPETLQAAVDKGDTVRVPLSPENQVAVFLLYWTAFQGQDGIMNFRGDPYGWDKTLAAKIEARSASKAAAAGK
ncbi:L,D-transpeptidase family protein [Sphingomonas sp.]|uniref:L,D-transpeptidase family protein n=1 Tax=Sphingomonas sp. TaxID=28214 RepID=UPI001B0C9A43|nr:L,D-transpeptidase family protein [Sphingomonas sp.]MBO9712268.1 L,D-transpeptidase family protein [Sphingomonas sp.]